MDKLGLIKLLGLPDTFGQMLLALALVATLVPYAAGKDFGVVKVPEFPDSAKRLLRVAGPIALTLALFIYLPLWSKPQANDIVLSSPFGDRQILLNGQKLLLPASDLEARAKTSQFVEYQKYLFHIALPAPSQGFRHELLSAPAYAKLMSPNRSGPFLTDGAELIASFPILRDAMVFRLFADKPIRMTTSRDTRLGPQAPPEEYKTARREYFDNIFKSPLANSAPSASSPQGAASAPTSAELDQMLEKLNIGTKEDVFFFNELSILIVDRKQFEKTMMASNGGRLVSASPLAFMLSAGGTLPAFDVLAVKEASISQNNRVWGFYGQRQFLNVDLNGNKTPQVFYDFYRLYTMNDAYLYQITLSYIPTADQPRDTWDNLVASLGSLKVADLAPAK